MKQQVTAHSMEMNEETQAVILNRAFWRGAGYGITVSACLWIIGVAIVVLW
ncbi:MAG: hypothetical protein ACE5F1_06035 [Planctomycetota bacterium]